MNTPATFDAVADEAFHKRVEGFGDYARQMSDQAASPADKAGWAAAGRLFTQYAEDMRGAVTLSTTDAFDERLVLPDARNPVEILFLGRANTDGDAVAWLPKRKVMVTGDIVVAPFPFGFGSYPSDWLRTLGSLRAFDFKILVPGHGAPQRDRAYLDRLASAISVVRGKVAPLVAEGLSAEDVVKRLDVSEQAKGFVGEDPWLRRWFAEYWIKPIAASAYKEAKGEPIVQNLGGE